MTFILRSVMSALLTAAFAMTSNVALSQTSEIRVFAAGSLRQTLDEVITAYRSSNSDRVNIMYGPSGKLRERIEQGDLPDIFIPAAYEHAQIVEKKGLLRAAAPYVKNSLCLMAAPGVRINVTGLIDMVLDPTLKLGTSTPGADPSGDYAWQLLRNIDGLRPGSFAILDKKALQLVGREIPQRVTESAYATILREHQADIFISYCTGAVEAAHDLPGLTWVRFPDEINVSAVYGIGISKSATQNAERLYQYLLGSAARAIFERHGFTN